MPSAAAVLAPLTGLAAGSEPGPTIALPIILVAVIVVVIGGVVFFVRRRQ